MTPAGDGSNPPRVLVKEKIGESGVGLLREAGFDVELGADWEDGELERRIGEFDAILIRSATKLTADLIGRADRLRAVGRAGVGVDNVDVDAATRRGIVVANAPQSNVITAAEHTMALLTALARNVPQAHASLTAGAWDRSKYSGVELYEKTLGILGFGRIGQLVAQRARGFGMRVLAFDAYVAEERFRELGVERADSSDAVYAAADFITVHLPKTPETENWLDAGAFAKMKDGVRVLNVARGPLVVDEDLKAAIDSGKVAGAALDVFREEPITDHPLFGYPNVIVTPHLGASTAEATDRAGYQAAEQVVAALTGGVVTSAVNVPAVPSEDAEALGPFLGLAGSLGRIAVALAEGSSVDALEVEYLGRVAERDTRLLTVQVLKGALAGHTEEQVNDVNAPTLAEERGISVAETKRATARDFTDLVRVAVISAGGARTRVVGTVLGRRDRPHLLEAWGSRFNVQLEHHLAIFRYEDRPGMLGRVGVALGEAGVNIVSAAVGRRPDDGGADGEATMVVTADAAVPQSVVDSIVASDGFVAGRTVSL
jgi:D-3-phosphoglycerate dehydrogenase